VNLDTPVINVGLPIALAIIMFGLGLSLTVGDFVRVGRYPKAALVALGCQVLLLPLLAFGLIELFGLTAVLAVGMMLLAASPGGTTANLFSHLAGGDVALNITLTAINSVLAAFTLPIVVNLSVSYFMGAESDLALPFSEVAGVIAIVLVPVAIGMTVRHFATGFADRMDKPVKIGSALVLAAVIVTALVIAWDVFLDNVLLVGSISLVLCVLSILLGYWAPRLFGVGWRQRVASAMEVGVHNATLALVVALTIMGNESVAVAPAMYGLLMFFPAAAAGYWFARHKEQATTAEPAVQA
jgi:BASS family bile acid:Na+ symporter